MNFVHLVDNLTKVLTIVPPDVKKVDKKSIWNQHKSCDHKKWDHQKELKVSSKVIAITFLEALCDAISYDL